MSQSDNSSTNRGGRYVAFIYDPRFPAVGKATCKNLSLLTSTLITGSTAAGEAFLPHIQNVTKAKTPETMRLDVDVAEHVPQVLGKFGCKEERTWPVSFGQNEKGGMNEEEFAKYLFNSIVPLFPHANGKSPEGGLGTWVDELEPTHEVEIVGICFVSLCPQHYTCDAGDRPELRTLQDSVPKQP